MCRRYTVYGGSHNFVAAPSRSLVLQSNQSALSATWASTSTAILAPPPMYVEQLSRCFAALRQLRHLRRHVTNDCFRSLVVSLVHSTLDYGNFLPIFNNVYLQSAFNAATRLVFRRRRYVSVILMSSRYYTGCLCQNGSTLNWFSWHTEC